MNAPEPLPVHGHRRANKQPAGFTLVELLVVIAIIAILASLITVAAFRAMTSAKQTRIKVELDNLDLALKSYKTDRGAFPPSDLTNKAAVQRHVAKAFSMSQEPVFSSPTYPTTLGSLSPAEAIVFWLGGAGRVVSPAPAPPLAGFSPNPKLPLSGSGEGKPLFQFEPTRLVKTRTIDIPTLPSGTRTIQLYVYCPASGELAPYVYFDFKNYNSVNSKYTGTYGGTGAVRPYPTKILTGVPEIWANPETFQIVSAGLDGDYGAGGKFPEGDGYTAVDGTNLDGYLLEDEDNLTNFSEKTLGDAMP